MWVGRAAVFIVGLLVVVCFSLATGAQTADAAKRVPVVRKGVENTVKRMTTLVGSIAVPILKIDNDGTGPALALEVEAGNAPLEVNPEAGTASGLSADELDGLNAAQFVQGGGTIHHFGPMRMDVGDSPQELVSVGSFTLQAECRSDQNATTAIMLLNDSSGPVSVASQSNLRLFQALAQNRTSFLLSEDIGGQGQNVTANGYAHALASDEQIFFDIYHYRYPDDAPDGQGCTFGGQVAESPGTA